jgi:hypothetical protein
MFITADARLALHRKRVNVSSVLASQKAGITEVEEGLFMCACLGERNWESGSPSVVWHAYYIRPKKIGSSVAVLRLSDAATVVLELRDADTPCESDS